MSEIADAPPPPPPDPPEPRDSGGDSGPPDESAEPVDLGDEAEDEAPPEESTPPDDTANGPVADEALAEAPPEDRATEPPDFEGDDELVDEAEREVPDEDLEGDGLADPTADDDGSADPATDASEHIGTEDETAGPSAQNDAGAPDRGATQPETDGPTPASDAPVEDRPSIADRYPDDYEKASAQDEQRLTDLRSRSDDPDGWAEGVNPGFEEQRGLPPTELPDKNRTTNCCECARAVQDTLDGRPTVAAASNFDGYAGTDRIDEWAGRPSEPATFSSIEERLAEPGDSAVVTVAWDDASGHAFNAVNVDGEVCYVDGQTGEVSEWPPPFAGDAVEGSVRAWFFPGEE